MTPALAISSQVSVRGTHLTAPVKHTYLRARVAHARVQSARTLVVTAGMLDGLFGGEKGAPKVH